MTIRSQRLVKAKLLKLSNMTSSDSKIMCHCHWQAREKPSDVDCLRNKRARNFFIININMKSVNDVIVTATTIERDRFAWRISFLDDGDTLSAQLCLILIFLLQFFCSFWVLINLHQTPTKCANGLSFTIGISRDQTIALYFLHSNEKLNFNF